MWLRSHSFRAKPNTQPLNSKIDCPFIPNGYCWEFIEASIAPDAPLSTSVFDAGDHTPLKHVPSQNLSQVKGQSPAFPLSGALQTPVKVEKLAYYLEGYNVQAYEELLSDFLHGFRLHFHGPQIGQVSTNLLSAAQHPEIVDSKLPKEVLAGRVLGSFKHPPFDNFRVSALGVIHKKTG